MTMQALTKFREKYPGYDDKSDEELANALATKYPDSYGDFPGMVSKSSLLDNRNSLRAKQSMRGGQAGALVDEFKTNPLTDPNLTNQQKATHALLKPAVTGVKALGTVGQAAERTASAPMAAMQMVADEPVNMEWDKAARENIINEAGNMAINSIPGVSQLNAMAGVATNPWVQNAVEIATDPAKRSEWIDIVKNSLTNKAATEYGDIAEAGGASKFQSSMFGLFATMFEPGLSEVNKTVKGVRQATQRLTGKMTNKAYSEGVEKFGKGILVHMTDANPEAVDIFLKHRHLIESNLTANQLSDATGIAVQKIEEATILVNKVYGDRIGVLADVYKNTDINVLSKAPPLEGVPSIMSKKVGDTLKNVTSKDPGAKSFVKLVKKYDKLAKTRDGKIPLNELRQLRKDLTAYINKGGVKHVDDRVSIAATVLKKDLADASYDALPDYGLANKHMTDLNAKLEGRQKFDSLASGVDIKTQLTPDTQGRRPLEKYFENQTAARTRRATEKLEGALDQDPVSKLKAIEGGGKIPDGPGLVEDLQTKAAREHLSKAKGTHGASVGVVTTGMKNPAFGAGAMTAMQMFSRRQMSRLTQTMMGIPESIAKIADKPISQAVASILSRFSDAAIATESRRTAIKDDQPYQ